MIKITLGCFFLFSFNACWALSQNGQLMDANRLFTKGDYSPAINLSENLKKSGLQNVALYCNLGNAYYKTGKTGLAILNYEKGLLISPLDTNIIHNEAFVNTQSGLPAFSAYLPGFNDDTVLAITYKAVNIATILLFMSGLLYLLSAFSFLSRYKALNRLVYRFCLFTSLPVLIACCVLVYYFNSQHCAIIIANTCTKTGPGTEAKKTYSLKEGEKVKILDRFENWCEVENYNGATGWVTTDSLASID